MLQLHHGLLHPPTIAPADPVTCDYTADTDAFTHAKTLNNVTTLYWRVVDKMVDAALVFKQRTGWLSIGARTDGVKKAAMMSSSILLGIVDDGDVPMSVEEYKIHHTLSTFSAWSTPLNQTVANKGLSSTECGSTLTFTTGSFGGEPLNATGTNRLLWAADKDHQGTRAPHVSISSSV